MKCGDKFTVKINEGKDGRSEKTVHLEFIKQYLHHYSFWITKNGQRLNRESFSKVDLQELGILPRETDVKADTEKARHKIEEKIRRKPRPYNLCYLTYNGETLRSVEWAERLNISAGIIRTRLNRGYTDEEALFGKRRVKACQ